MSLCLSPEALAGMSAEAEDFETRAHRTNAMRSVETLANLRLSTEEFQQKLKEFKQPAAEFKTPATPAAPTATSLLSTPSFPTSSRFGQKITAYVRRSIGVAVSRSGGDACRQSFEPSSELSVSSPDECSSSESSGDTDDSEPVDSGVEDCLRTDVAFPRVADTARGPVGVDSELLGAAEPPTRPVLEAVKLDQIPFVVKAVLNQLDAKELLKPRPRPPFAESDGEPTTACLGECKLLIENLERDLCLQRITVQEGCKEIAWLKDVQKMSSTRRKELEQEVEWLTSSYYSAQQQHADALLVVAKSTEENKWLKNKQERMRKDQSNVKLELQRNLELVKGYKAHEAQSEALQKERLCLAQKVQSLSKELANSQRKLQRAQSFCDRSADDIQALRSAADAVKEQRDKALAETESIRTHARSLERSLAAERERCQAVTSSLPECVVCQEKDWPCSHVYLDCMHVAVCDKCLDDNPALAAQCPNCNVPRDMRRLFPNMGLESSLS